MKIRKIVTVVLGAVLLTSAIAGCGSKPETDSNAGDSQPSAAATEPETAAASADPIRITEKSMTEQMILGEMLKLVIEDSTDYTVEVTQGFANDVTVVQAALEKGEFDLYPEYTSTGWANVLGHSPAGVDDEEMFEQLNKEYNEQFDMSWIGRYGFNNTYAVVVRTDVADQYNLKTTSDLAAVSDQLTFGANSDYFEREDGYNLLAETYGFKFTDVKEFAEISLRYAALKSGDIDVANGYTTDAQIGMGYCVALEDDLHLQANYYCSTVVRNEVLETHPGLEEALMKMDGMISDAEMAQLNYQLEEEGKDEADIAKAFLVEKGIIKG